MGQENEEMAETLAAMQVDHAAMKAWYNGSHPSAEPVRTKYGPSYPTFWRDVVDWPGWRDARRAYLTFTEKNGEQDATGAEDKSKNVSTTESAEASKRRKRRSRWGVGGGSSSQGETPSAPAAPASSSGGDGDSSTQHPPKRRSRWARGRDETPRPVTTSAVPVVPVTPAPPPADQAVLAALGGIAAASTVSSEGVLKTLLPGMPGDLTPEQEVELKALQARLRVANEKLRNLDEEAARVDALPRDHPDRSPSPPPVYGADGVRKNTRAVRWRERYGNERQDCLERIMDLNPAMRPAGFVRRKRNKKIYIPVDEHPTYNFIGLIIGPRGKTQKEMEAKTGCKIAIRGKGSIKEGARGRRDGKSMEGDDDPLHVVITGDDQASVDTAAEMIEKMLVVIDDDLNVHKQKQLRELALLNGTLKDEEFCPICAEKGHRSFECPKRFAMNNKAAISVKCAICGDTSHPTRDCTQKSATDKDEEKLDSDYKSFMAELDGKKVESKPEGAGVNPIAGAASSVVTISSTTGGAVVEKDLTSLCRPVGTCSAVTTISSKVVTDSGEEKPIAPSTTIIPASGPAAGTAFPGVLTPQVGLPPPPSGPPPSVLGTANAVLPPPPAGFPPAAVPPPPTPVSGTPPTETVVAASGTEANASSEKAEAPGHSAAPPGELPPQPLSTEVATTSKAEAGSTVPPPPPLPPTVGATSPAAAPSTIAPPLPPPPPHPPVYGYSTHQSYQAPYYANGAAQGAYQNQQYQGGWAGANDWNAGSMGRGRGQTNVQQRDDTAGWDYRSYFGTAETGGDAGGAGGFNWWEESS